ncbi:hypothetical protein HWV62_44573 [Athelia sp. TMB]|nr:hypothetical protein HWV62_44573 [Athelia sp. TMB]
MHRQLHRRQNSQLSSLFQEPTNIAGLTGAATATASAGASDSLLMTSGTANGADPTAPPLIVGGDTVTLTSSGSSSSTAAASPSTKAASSSSSGSQMSMGTVIGACIGAFAIFGAIILGALWCYRRSIRRPTRSRSRSISNNLDSQKMKVRSEPWNKINEKDQGDVWEGMMPGPSKESSKDIITALPPARTATPAATTLDKLGGMFKKTPSMRSTDAKSLTSYGHDDFGDSLANAQRIAQYHPHLAEELAKTVLPMRPELARADTSAISWGGDTVSGDNLDRSMNSPLLSIASEVMSPTFVNVKSTPTAITSQPHRWESAEVMHFDDSHPAGPQNPFADAEEERTSSDRKSVVNPFFNAQGSQASLPRRRRSQSNPFSDDAQSAHSPAQSVDEDNEDRMQSLIAALDITQEAQQRARIASMHPSILSTASAYEDNDSVADFPIPPTPTSAGSIATTYVSARQG